MYREMRRKDRLTSEEEAIELLEKGEYGILATTDNDNLPYAVPVNYVLIDKNIYFHCAIEGQKLDNIMDNNNVSFCVVGKTKVLAEKFSTAYQSTIAFGEASIVEDKEEKQKALHVLIEKYSSDFIPEGEAYIKRAADATHVVRIEIKHITGKHRIE